MDYELAKQLKDAGFPQRFNGNLFDENGKLFYLPDITIGNYVSCPTLSELIEACGDRFDSLHKIPSGHKGDFKLGGAWMTKEKIENGTRSYGWFDTPEESVANLWLALQNKK